MTKFFQPNDILYIGGYCGRVIRIIPHPAYKDAVPELEIETLYADPKKPNIIKIISSTEACLLTEEISYLRNRADKLEKILIRAQQ